MSARGFKPHARTPRAGFSTEGLILMRGRWRELAELARSIGCAARGGEPIDRLVAAQLQGQLIRTGAADLPLEGESVRRVRTAFLEGCRALLVAAPDRRPIIAELAIAAAQTVLDLLDLETRKAAAGWQKQFRD